MGLLECKQSNCGGLGAACPGNSDALCAPDKRCISSSCSDPGDLGAIRSILGVILGLSSSIATGAICEESSDCGNGASCSQVVCGGNGGACAGNSQCLSGACVQSVCSPPSPIGGECDPFDSQDCIGLVSCAVCFFRHLIKILFGDVVRLSPRSLMGLVAKVERYVTTSSVGSSLSYSHIAGLLQ